MPEHPNAERELDSIIARVVEAAGADAPAPPSPDRFTVPAAAARVATRRRRWLPLAAAAVVVGGIVAAVVVATRGGDRSPTPAVPTGSAPPVVTAEPATSTSAEVAVTSTVLPASTTPPTSAARGLTRPIIDPATCMPLYARDGVVAGVSLFARSSSLPIAMQVIGDPQLGPAGPFALVQRYFETDRTPAGPEEVSIDGRTFWIGVYPNGNGQVEWDVGDGSQGYLRSRGLDRDTLLAIVAALSPRPAEATVPGFDYSPPSAALQLLHEQLNTEVRGEVHRSACQSATTGLQYRVSVIGGDPVFQYGGVIDRHVPLEVGVVDGSVVVIDGVADANQARTTDVVDASPDFWAELTAQPEYDLATAPRYDVAVGEPIEVDLRGVTDGTPTSPLTLQIVESQGVAALQCDTSAAVLADDAVLWSIVIDGRGRALTSAGAGGVSAQRIGDAPFTGEVNVTISVLDGGGFTLQTTGPLQLVVT